MKLIKRITRSNFLIRLRHWEFWPFGIVQFPAIVYWLWLSLRSRSLTFFSASNPGIQMGGMFGESKYEVLKKIDEKYVPKTIFISLPARGSEVLVQIRKAGMSFPLIFKPDVGERGFMVKKVSTLEDIESYLREIKVDFLVQDLIDLPMEFGVFYVRLPGAPRGEVTSVVGKKMLSVEGDGTSTLGELILQSDRAKLQLKKLQSTFGSELSQIVPAGKKIELVSIGNHAVGTVFLDASYLINTLLSEAFDSISIDIEGFYFGRFDVRCASLGDLYNGEVKILELNGCGAIPAHIYDPDFSFWKAMVVLVDYWRKIFVIARANKKLGVNYVPFREALACYRKFRSIMK